MTGTTGYQRAVRRIARAAALLVAVSLSPMAAAQSDKIDPQAVKLLKAATDFVASQKAFTADTRNTLEVVLTSGQKIQFDHAAKLSLQRPNKLRAERTGDLVNQVFYYDGKAITLSNPAEKYFATVAAPPTLEEMLNFARSSLDIIAPAGDLLYRNAFDILMTDVSSGFVVGKGFVEGVRCDHLAFRAPHVDWQIWIEDGARPLPRKLVITTRDVVNAPQFAVVVTRWDLRPKQTEGMFTYTPAKDAKKVEFLPAAAAVGPAGR